MHLEIPLEFENSNFRALMTYVRNESSRVFCHVETTALEGKRPGKCDVDHLKKCIRSHLGTEV